MPDIRKMSFKESARSINHLMLDPLMTGPETRAGCEMAKEYGVSSVTVKPCFVRIAVDALRHTDVRVGTVVGFPHGVNTSQVKLAEAKRALMEGAEILTTVLNPGLLRARETDLVLEDLTCVSSLAHMNKAEIKIMLETGYLTDEEIMIACQLTEKVAADWIVDGADCPSSSLKLSKCRIMLDSTTDALQVECSKGINSLEDFFSVIEIGCNQVGTKDTGKILQYFKKWKSGKYPLNMNEITMKRS